MIPVLANGVGESMLLIVTVGFIVAIIGLWLVAVVIVYAISKLRERVDRGHHPPDEGIDPGSRPR